MIVVAELIHKKLTDPKTGKLKEARITLWGMDAQQVARIQQSGSRHKAAILDAEVKKFIAAKMPSTYFGYTVIDWEFSEHTEDETRGFIHEKRTFKSGGVERSSLAPFI